MTTRATPAPVVLVPGHWLGAWAWDEVAEPLRAAGHPVHPVTLPGLDPADPDRATRTLTDQVDALATVVATTGPSTVLVAHSGGGHPVTVLLDRAPRSVARAVLVDSGPTADGATSTGASPDDLLPAGAVELALPPFDELVASLAGLTDAHLARFRARAVPEPAAVVRAAARLHDDARRDVPTTIVACSFPGTTVLELARAGHPMMAEVAELRDLEVVDLPTGHWPMWSRPADLAAVILGAARP